ncbi:universal stress protein [Streptomyces venezuelae]|uniref:Universal stress protein n=1 Tax=Streptomyces venezuelae TaxID=54571 RepID=A0A5P2CWF2_STRVZ|nr:universal stress protein [Streptomyces venezuelae]QES47234.1 universal stress protein [Streptomyces venezuelae]
MITHGKDDGPIVVAVDGSEHSLKALEWALPVARTAGAEVLIAHVKPDHAQLWQARREAVLGDPAPGGKAPDPVADHVRGVLEGREGLPSIRYASLEGAVPQALNTQAEQARMLVLGSRGRGGFASLLLGSTSRACATTAPCPVVVVPHSARDRREGSEAAGRVVLGLDPSETGDRAIEFAFRQAELFGATLVALTAFADPVAPFPLIGAPMPAAPDQDMAPLLREIGRAQQERLAPLADGHRDVTVESVVGPGDPAGQLVDQSETADLLVVGRHRRRLRKDSLLMGSVANAALLHAECPVAVVPAE